MLRADPSTRTHATLCSQPAGRPRLCPAKWAPSLGLRWTLRLGAASAHLLSRWAGHWLLTQSLLTMESALDLYTQSLQGTNATRLQCCSLATQRPWRVPKHRRCLQGTNAHVLLEPTAMPAAVAEGFPWQRRRFWVGPAAHCLLQCFAGSGCGTADVRFELALSQPRLAPLQDHQVRTSSVFTEVSIRLPAFANARPKCTKT